MRRVQNTHNAKQLRELHGAMVDLMAVVNEPARDVALLREAGVTLDRALFGLLVGIDRFGPVSVGDLAARSGRDHTTVSRQVAKLVDLSLIVSKPGEKDRRVNHLTISAAGKEIIERLHEGRARRVAPILERWSEKDFGDLVRLMRRFVDDLVAMTD